MDVEKRANQIHRFDPHDLLMLFLQVTDVDLSEELEGRSEPDSVAANAVRPSLAFAVIGSDEDDELIALPTRKRLQDDRFGSLPFHTAL
jgi:hypothetical protein